MTDLRRALFCLFRDRFFEADADSPGGNEQKFYQALGLLAAPGLMVSMFLIPQFMELSFRPPGPQVDWALRAHRLFFPLYSFAVVGFATFFEWDRLFPARLDFLILTPFPVRTRDLFLAKLASLGRLIGALVIAVNLFSVLLLPVFTAYIRQARAAGVLRLALAQTAATAVAALFGFFAVAAAEGVLMNVLSPRFFRRISPWIQMTGMSCMVLCLLLYPLWSAGMKPLAERRPELLRYFPIYWFVGIYDVVLPTHSPLFASLGMLALKGLGVALLVFCGGWAGGFRRHCRRTLESEDAGNVPRRSLVPASVAARWIRDPEELAIFSFAGATLARSQKHRLFLATYLSAGVAFGILFAVDVRNGRLSLSPEGLRMFPFLLTFFAVSGLRAAFQFPAEQASNWIFQIAGKSMRETARRATRKRVAISGLAPVLLVSMPLEFALWGGKAGLFHLAFQAAAGLLLTEALFWNFDKAPFTCSYYPGATNLAILAGLALYGFTSYSFHMAELEAGLERTPGHAILFLAAAAAVLWLLGKRQASDGRVRYDGSEPEFQTLDLT
jgi:hypothetical protein